MKEKTVLKFSVFGQWTSGQVITNQGDKVVVYARNPYGSHNLILCEKTASYIVNGQPVDEYESFRLGDAVVFDYVNCWFTMKRVKKVLNFLIKKGKLEVLA